MYRMRYISAYVHTGGNGFLGASGLWEALALANRFPRVAQQPGPKNAAARSRPVETAVACAAAPGEAAARCLGIPSKQVRYPMAAPRTRQAR